ncbi:MAG: GrpB family protein [Bacillota bacterium]
MKVDPYNPAWPRDFREEAERLRAVFGREVVYIHHIGSTAVPGLAAKPIVDILPVVRDIDAADRLNGNMETLGYEPMGEFGLPGRRYFRSGYRDRAARRLVAGPGGAGSGAEERAWLGVVPATRRGIGPHTREGYGSADFRPRPGHPARCRAGRAPDLRSQRDASAPRGRGGYPA